MSEDQPPRAEHDDDHRPEAEATPTPPPAPPYAPGGWQQPPQQPSWQQAPPPPVYEQQQPPPWQGQGQQQQQQQPGWQQQPPSWQQPYGMPGYNQQDPGRQAGWTPPPKPGLVPLRPLSFGTVFGAPYQLLRRNPKATFGSALLVQAIVLVLTAAIMTPLAFYFVGRVQNASTANVDAVTSGGVAAIILGALVTLIVSAASSAFLQGVIVLETARATLGEKLRLSQLWRLVLRRFWPLFGWITLFWGAFLVIAIVLVVVVTLLVAGGGPLIAAGVIVGIFGGIALVVLGVWLYTKSLFTPCAIVLEERGIFAALGRSWSLTRGAFWKIFGINLLVTAVVNTASQVVTTPVSILFGFAGSFIAPNGGSDPIIMIVVVYAATIVVSLVVGAIASVVQSGTIALLYIDQRMRREALDLELTRFVEGREAGVTGTDPYLVPATA